MTWPRLLIPHPGDREDTRMRVARLAGGGSASGGPWPPVKP
jgi:hypothetical protein